MNAFQFGLCHLLQLQMCVYSYTWMPSQWKLVFFTKEKQQQQQKIGNMYTWQDAKTVF